MPLPNLGVLRIVHDAMHTHTHTHTDSPPPAPKRVSRPSSLLEILLTDDDIGKIVHMLLFDPVLKEFGRTNHNFHSIIQEVKKNPSWTILNDIYALRGKLNDAQKQLFRPGSESWDFSGLQSFFPEDITFIGKIIDLLDPDDKPSKLIFRDMPYSQQSGVNTKQIQALADVITDGHLESLKFLDIGGNKANATAHSNFVKAIRGGGLKSLQHLDLAYCGTSFDALVLFVNALQNDDDQPTLPLLENLILNNNRIYAAGMLAFAKAVTAGALKSLKHLELRSTNIRFNDGMMKLSNAIRNGALLSLEHLNLSSNLIGNEQIEAFIDAITDKTLQSLTHLDLSDNFIDDTGMLAFATAIRQPGTLPSLQSLNLSKNRIIGEQGMNAFIYAITDETLQSLKHLDLSHNRIGNAGMTAFTKVIQQPGTLPSLQSLNLRYNHIGHTEMHAFVTAVTKQGALPLLQHLDLQVNIVFDLEVKSISQIIEDEQQRRNITLILLL